MPTIESHAIYLLQCNLRWRLFSYLRDIGDYVINDIRGMLVTTSTKVVESIVVAFLFI